MFYDNFRKFREPPLEGLFDKNESEGANGSLPFFVASNLVFSPKICGVNRTMEKRSEIKL